MSWERELEKLTTQQREAILHRGSPLLIIAGPGSGKTEVIAWRVAHLVRAGHARPENVLAVTFTNKAALELKDRIQDKLPPRFPVELMQVSTIHSFCADLLRRYRPHTALPRGLRILDEAGQFLLVYSNRKALRLDTVVKSRPHGFFADVIDAFNLATEELVEPAGLEAWCRKSGACCCASESDLWQERTVVAEAYRRYGELLREQGLVDFAFLQRHALDLLRGHADVLEELRRQYTEVLVDEYQDTNAAQDRLLALLAGDGHHLAVVGDDDQSLYRFRGATVRNLLTFPERFPGTRVVRLEHNFRSRDPIVQHSLRVIVHNPARFPKDLLTVRGPGSDVLLVYERTADEEAHAVVDLLRRLRAAGRLARYGDVAILLRSVRSYAVPYLQALQEASIPYQVIGLPSFFEREEIAQLYNLFNFLAVSQPDIDIHLRQPLVGLSPAACAALQAHKGPLQAVASEEGLREIGIAGTEDRQRLLALLALKQRVQAKEHRSLLEVYYDLLAATGCAARFELEGNSEALANLGILSRLVATWDEIGPTRNFYPFREYLELLRKGGLDPAAFPPEDCVQVMTIHQSKGLEFPVVVLGAAMDGRLPTSRWRERYEVPYSMRASGEPEVADPHLVDERKLFYVAVTRARDLLIVGTANVVNKRGGGPSPFLHEMFGDDLTAAADLARAYIADVESRPAARLGPRERHSFSQIAYYLQCPVRYKFAEVYGLQAPWLDPVDFGANVHRALEEIHARALADHMPTEDDIESILAETWIASRRVRPEREEGIRQAAARQLRRYLHEHGETLRRVLRAETSFSFALKDQVLSGKIDLLRQAGDDRVEIVDFKTSAALPVEQEHYDLQMDLYALGTEASLAWPVARQTVHFLGDGQVETWGWSPQRREIAEGRLADVLGCIERQEFPPTTAYCPNCEEFRAICPYAPGDGGDRDENL
jgi:DNA helicase-2/ATP-dependent DNA helicase PcrA